ncbi:MAG: hypothetical protein NTW89_03580 [Burkholderiales bacterium]|nr:hypothetical protein [Burkholderiales bacterium]
MKRNQHAGITSATLPSLFLIFLFATFHSWCITKIRLASRDKFNYVNINCQNKNKCQGNKLCIQILRLALFALVAGNSYAQSFQNNQSPAIEKCVDEKIALFRKLEGEGPLIRFNMLEEWRRDCTVLLAKQKSAPSPTAMGSWKVGSSGHLQHFRSHAFTKAGGDFLTLAIQFAPPACNYDWNVLFKLPEPNKSASVLVWTQKIQIDNGRVWQSRATYRQRVGDEVAIFTQEPVNGYNEILQAMANGNVLHLALEVEGKSFGVEQFSLIGFTAATNQARGLCLGAAR